MWTSEVFLQAFWRNFTSGLFLFLSCWMYRVLSRYSADAPVCLAAHGATKSFLKEEPRMDADQHGLKRKEETRLARFSVAESPKISVLQRINSFVRREDFSERKTTTGGWGRVFTSPQESQRLGAHCVRPQPPGLKLTHDRKSDRYGF